MLFESKYRRQALQSWEAEKAETKREIQESLQRLNCMNRKFRESMRLTLQQLFSYSKSIR